MAALNRHANVIYPYLHASRTGVVIHAERVFIPTERVFIPMERLFIPKEITCS